MALAEYEKLKQAGKISVSTSANIPCVEESSATGEVAELFQHFHAHFGRPDVPGILKCFATHPPLLRHMMDLSESLIFAEGLLGRRYKEMIATFVSTENACAYCADSHAYFLRIHGGSSGVLSALQHSDLTSPELSVSERVLLEFCRKVNMHSDKIAPPDVALAVDAGWTQMQIAEAVHITALFATFNRVANAFGLQSQGLLSLYVDDGDPAGQGHTCA